MRAIFIHPCTYVDCCKKVSPPKGFPLGFSKSIKWRKGKTWKTTSIFENIGVFFQRGSSSSGEINGSIDSYIHTYMHIYIHTHIHTHSYTHTHTHTHTHTLILYDTCLLGLPSLSLAWDLDEQVTIGRASHHRTSKSSRSPRAISRESRYIETERAAQQRRGRRHVHERHLPSWRHAHEQDLPWRTKGSPWTRSDNKRDSLVLIPIF